MAPRQRAGDDAQGARHGRRARRPRHGPGPCGLVHLVRPSQVLAAALRGPLVRPGPRRRGHVGRRRRGRRRGHRGPARAAATSRNAARIEPDPAAGRVRVRRITATGYDLLEAPMPAVVVCTQALGEPRYPSLKGIMAARSKEIATRSLRDLGMDAAGRRRGGGDHGGARQPAAPGPRGDDAWSRGPAADGAARDRRLPRRAEDHLMPPRIWVVAETDADGSLARISTEVATLARTLADAAGAGPRSGSSWPPSPDAAARRARGYLPRVVAITDPAAAGHAWAPIAAERAVGDPRPGWRRRRHRRRRPRRPRRRRHARRRSPGWGVLANATSAAWDGDGPTVETSVLGGKLDHDQRVHRRAAGSSPSARTR